MVLHDEKIKELIEEINLVSGDKNKYSIEPGSVDLTLGLEVYVSKKSNKFIFCDRDIDTEIIFEQAETEKDMFFIPPKSFALATTNEVINLPNYLSAIVEGRSSIGRMGLFIHNAGWIDSGFKGQITLELFNASENTIVLKKDMRICQIVFLEMTGESLGYKGKYQNQVGTTKSKIFKDFKK